MKKWMLFWVVLCLVLTAGCAAEPVHTTPSPEETLATAAPEATQSVPATEAPTTIPAAEPETQPPVDVEGMLWAVVEGICPMVTPEGESGTLGSYLARQYGADAASAALVDFDADGVTEMVVSTTSEEASYVVLHYSDGYVFAFTFGARSMSCLKVDGSFLAASSASQTDYCRLRFHSGRYILVCEASEDSEDQWYTMNGEVSSREEVADFARRWHAKPDADWIWLGLVPEQTQPPQSSFEAYLQNIPLADQSIYSGPGYDYSFVGTVQIAGIYTIVEEGWDDEGNLWGRLKSGVGWVDLTQIRESETDMPPVTANFADDRLLSGSYHHYAGDSPEYAVQIAFRANEALTAVRIYLVTETPEGDSLLEERYFLRELTPEKPLVADLDFPGDMSMYVLNFLDSRGRPTWYSISLSGRNGSLVFVPYTP